MQPDQLKQLEDLFHTALERAPEERAAFLDEGCAGNDSLRRMVESLLAHHDQAGSFIESPAVSVAAAIFEEPVESQVGRSIGHYEVLELLGAGGMGEVYLAQDTSLGRKVALKLLPAAYTSDATRLRRFEQEARTASALNHPNIVTIYEIGYDDSAHFIATEYLDGATLRAHLKTTQVNAGEALDIAVQVVSALVAAHAKGIVHRDIKPENIMVLKESYSLHRENYVKVLDFGIVKLTESNTAGTEAPTRPLINTNQGMVLGTASYMSPEQARGTVVDARTDIWSLGVVLYEMLAGRIPFDGETAEDMRAAILKDKLPPLSAEIPERLKWIVEKALRKDREDRYQTAREFFSDLKELQQQESISEALREHSISEAATDGSVAVSERYTTAAKSTGATNKIAQPPTSSAEYIVGEFRRHKRGLISIAAIVLVAGIVVVYGAVILVRRSQFFKSTTTESSRSMRMVKLTDSGNVTAAAISPDGNYVVYAWANEGRQSLWLRQINPPSEREIVSPLSGFIRGPTFSNDGNVIYYTMSDMETIFDAAALYQVPLLGGTPRRVLANVSSPISFSPDGRRFAFVKQNLGGSFTSSLNIANADGTDVQMLASLGGNKFFEESGPAWSPDGKVIACGAAIDPKGIHNTVVAVSVDDRTQKAITSFEGWTGLVERVAWIRDSSGLIVIAAQDVTTGNQIWHLSYPDGEVRRITNDLNNYSIDSLTLTRDSMTLAAVQRDRTSNLWVVTMNDDASHARQITQGKWGGGSGVAWTPDGKIVSPRRSAETSDLWIMDQDGKNLRQLTGGGPSSGFKAYPAFSRDGRYLAFNSDRVNISHIWRTDADGNNPKQLTDGDFEDYSPVFTPDGQWILFASWRSVKLATWKVSINGGEPLQLARETSPWPAVSADGKLFASGYHDDDPNTPWKLAIYPIEGGAPIKLFEIAATVKFQTGLSWMPDGRSLIYVDTRNGVSNLWSQRVDGGKPKQITNFTSDLIFRFALSTDGRQLVLARGAETRDVVLIKDFK